MMIIAVETSRRRTGRDSLSRDTNHDSANLRTASLGQIRFRFAFDCVRLQWLRFAFGAEYFNLALHKKWFSGANGFRLTTSRTRNESYPRDIYSFIQFNSLRTERKRGSAV